MSSQLHEVNGRSFAASHLDTLTFVIERKRIDTLISLGNKHNDTFVLRTTEKKIGRAAHSNIDTITEQTTFESHNQKEHSNPLMAERKKGGGLCPVLIRLLVLLIIILIILTFLRKLKK